MKCRFIVDVDADISGVPESEKPKLKWRTSKNYVTGEPRPEPYFPAGTEYEHPGAAGLCDWGMAVPADAECEAAAKPMSPEQRADLELNYKAAALGIHDKKDVDLFKAGVIAGYESVEGQIAYKPGPNWAAYKAELDAEAKKDEGI